MFLVNEELLPAGDGPAWDPQTDIEANSNCRRGYELVTGIRLLVQFICYLDSDSNSDQVTLR